MASKEPSVALTMMMILCEESFCVAGTKLLFPSPELTVDLSFGSSLEGVVMGTDLVVGLIDVLGVDVTGRPVVFGKREVFLSCVVGALVVTSGSCPKGCLGGLGEFGPHRAS